MTSITAGTGLPLTPVYFAAVGGTGVTGSIRPDYTGAPLYAAPAGRFLNPGRLHRARGGAWGNAGRDIHHRARRSSRSTRRWAAPSA